MPIELGLRLTEFGRQLLDRHDRQITAVLHQRGQDRQPRRVRHRLEHVYVLDGPDWLRLHLWPGLLHEDILPHSHDRAIIHVIVNAYEIVSDWGRRDNHEGAET